ncbi:hypothetical protein O7626_11420 [Micromonospora sp. WMMD1102]|nr:hypothetical protein [Micromonospora sp. WMMD1102]MDG4786531.1 hypothetical protein [Micromonospora sp. WMMD1102]
MTLIRDPGTGWDDISARYRPTTPEAFGRSDAAGTLADARRREV